MAGCKLETQFMQMTHFCRNTAWKMLKDIQGQFPYCCFVHSSQPTRSITVAKMPVTGQGVYSITGFWTVVRLQKARILHPGSLVRHNTGCLCRQPLLTRVHLVLRKARSSISKSKNNPRSLQRWSQPLLLSAISTTGGRIDGGCLAYEAVNRQM